MGEGIHRVVVLMPVFNGQKDFDATMASLAQSTEPCDIVVVDDGSVPPLDTSGFNVHLIRLEHNQGIVAALNTGLEFALRQGYEYIARCMMVGCDVDLFAPDGEYLFTIAPPRDGKALAYGLRERSWLLHSTIMFRASVFAEVGLYSDEFKAAEDLELCLRIASKYEISVVPERLVSVVRSATGITSTRRRTQLVSRIRLQLRHFCWSRAESYSGLARSLISLATPGPLRRWLKRNYIYVHIGETTIRNPVSCVRH